jgi:hypothetical protein
MLNVVIVDPQDIGKNPQPPNPVHLVQPLTFAKWSTEKFIETGATMMMVLNTDAEIPVPPPELVVKITSEPAGIRKLKAMVEFVMFSLGRYRGAIEAKARLVHVMASQKRRDESLPKGWKRPENYPKWLEEQAKRQELV